jgi:GDP-4-dehydro-6-deoxy-D-mannose reductase
MSKHSPASPKRSSSAEPSLPADSPLARFSIYNVVSGENCSIQSIVTTLIDLATVPIEPVPEPSRLRPSDIAMAAGVFDRFRDEFGWLPKRWFDTTIAHVFEDQRDRL